MLCRKTEPILKEGWLYIAILCLIFLSSLFLSSFVLSFIIFIVMIATAYIFRNPERIPYEIDELSVYAPIDGKITHVGKVKEDRYYHKDMLLITIKSSLFDAGVFRNPLDIRVEKVDTIYGLGIDTDDEKSNLLNQRVNIIGESKNGAVLATCVSGQYSKKIYTLCGRFRELKKGDRYLFMSEGLVHLYLPLNCRIKVVKGEKVRAVETVLGYFLNDESS